MLLHSKGKLVGSDPRREFTVILTHPQLIHSTDVIQHSSLLLASDLFWWREMKDGRRSVPQLGSLVDRRKIPCSPHGRAAFRQPFRLRHHTVSREILALAAQPICNPASQAGVRRKHTA